MLEGTLYHKKEYCKSVNYKVVSAYGENHIVLKSIEPGFEDTLNLGKNVDKEHVRYCLHCWANKNGYTFNIPEYKMPSNPDIPWVVTHQEGIEFQIEYMCYGKTRRARISIPGADCKLSEELVRLAIVNEIQAAIRRHKYVGMSGVFKEAVKDVDDKSDSTNR